VSVLFCDLVDFTAFSEKADPEDVGATLRPYHARLQQEIEHFGGTVEKFIGDAVMAVFGAPVAHEDDAERAVRAGLRIVNAIEELNQSHPGRELALRIGINTGEAVVSLGSGVGDRQGLVAGDMVNTASRIESIAPTGGVVVGEATYRATKDLFDYDELDPVTVKGKVEPLAVWRAIAARGRYGGDVDIRPQTPFIGRDDELEMLKRMLGRAMKERSSQLVSLIGEPGVGKTRLVREFFAYIDSRPDLLVYWRQGRCLPYGDGITFWGLGEIVKAQAGILESDTPGEAADKLGATVDATVEDEGERDWLKSRLAPLIGLVSGETSEPAERLDSFGAWRKFFETMASTHPLILAIEDLHWADPAMIEFLEHLLDWSADVPMLVLCTARPELFERHPAWGGGKRNSTTISLSPLSDEEVGRLVAALLPRWALPDEIHELLLGRAEGNPLYAEEFARMLSDRELVREGEAGVPVEAWTGIPFPESIQALIAARLDTLSPDRKALLQDASVVGKTFWSGALSSMRGTDERTVQEGLHELTRKELVRPARTSSVKDQTEYAFWHILIRDVAYAQIPRASRARKHRLVAEWTQALAGDRVADQAEVLAYHYEQALELARAAGASDEAAKLEGPTRRFVLMAGDRAMGLDASRAVEHYGEALRLLPHEDAERARVLARAADAARRASLFVDAEARYEEAIAAFRAQRLMVEAGGAMVRLANVLWHRGETARSHEVLTDAIALLEQQDPGRELAHAYAEQSFEKLVMAEFEAVLEWAEKTIVLCQKVGSEEQMPIALGLRGAARWVLGDPGGLDDIRQGLEMSLAHSLFRESMRLHAILAEVLWLAEGPHASLEASQAGIELAEARGSVDWAMLNRSQTLAPLFDLGRWDEVVTTSDRLIRWSRAAGEGYQSIEAEIRKGEVLLHRGRLDEAARLTEASLPAARGIAEPQLLMVALAVAAKVRQGCGDVAGSLELVHELDAMRGGRSAWYQAPQLSDLVRTCVAGNDLALAERLTKNVPVHAVRHRLNVMTAHALLDEAKGELESASRTYTEVAERWEEYGSSLERGQTLLGAGRCLLRLGRPEASGYLERARSTFDGLEAGPLAAETTALLEDASALAS
jgi:class 3 adenylate cyclase/tetratricopeptide (TPR) repeat protein